MSVETNWLGRGGGVGSLSVEIIITFPRHATAHTTRLLHRQAFHSACCAVLSPYAASCFPPQNPAVAMTRLTTSTTVVAAAVAAASLANQAGGHMIQTYPYSRQYAHSYATEELPDGKQVYYLLFVVPVPRSSCYRSVGRPSECIQHPTRFFFKKKKIWHQHSNRVSTQHTIYCCIRQ